MVTKNDTRILCRLPLKIYNDHKKLYFNISETGQPG